MNIYKIYRSKIIIVFIALVLSMSFGIGLTIAINSSFEGWKVNDGAIDFEVTLADGTTKKCITNNSGNNYFVPTKTDIEWDAFETNAIDVIINDCVIPTVDGNYAWSKTGSVLNTYYGSLDVDCTGVYLYGTLGAYKLKSEDGSLLWENKYSDGTLGNNALVHSSEIHSSGLYVAGMTIDKKWLVKKIDSTNGNLLWEVVQNYSAGWDIGTSIRVDDSGVYIGGYDELAGKRWRMEKVKIDNGDIVWSQILDLPSNHAMVIEIDLDSTGLYVLGVNNWGHIGPIGKVLDFRLEKRSLSTGEVIWSKYINPTANHDNPYAISVYHDSVYLLYDSNSTGLSLTGYMQKRKVSDGELVDEISLNGLIGMYLAGVEVAEDGIYVMSSDFVNNSRYVISKFDFDMNFIWRKESNPTTKMDSPYLFGNDSHAIYNGALYFSGFMGGEWPMVFMNYKYYVEKWD